MPELTLNDLLSQQPQGLALNPLAPKRAVKSVANAPTEIVGLPNIEQQQPERTLGGTLGDIAATGLNAAISIPEAAVGLADIATGGKAGKALSDMGFQPKVARQFINENLTSPAQQYADTQVAQAKGFVPTVQAALKNPSTIGKSVVESLPLMGAGGLIGRGASAALKLSPAAAAAVGEGVISAGSTAEQIRQQTNDGLLTPQHQGLAALSGGLTGAIGGASNKLAGQLGISDIDTMLTGGAAGQTNKGLARRMVEGAAIEGALEEAPQSAQEQYLQNLALGKNPSEGVGNATAMGMLSGGLMGAGAGVLNKPARQDYFNPVLNKQQPQWQAPQATIKPNAVPATPLQQAIDNQYAENQNAYNPLAGTWEQPDFRVGQHATDIRDQAQKQNAQAIVNQNSVQGQDLQGYLDERNTNQNAYNPLAGAWETPTAVNVEEENRRLMDETNAKIDAMQFQKTRANRNEVLNQVLGLNLPPQDILPVYEEALAQQGFNNAKADEYDLDAIDLHLTDKNKPAKPVSVEYQPNEMDVESLVPEKTNAPQAQSTPNFDSVDNWLDGGATLKGGSLVSAKGKEFKLNKAQFEYAQNKINSKDDGSTQNQIADVSATNETETTPAETVANQFDGAGVQKQNEQSINRQQGESYKRFDDDHFKQGLYDNANQIKVYEDALSKNPNDERAKLELDNLNNKKKGLANAWFVNNYGDEYQNEIYDQYNNAKTQQEKDVAYKKITDFQDSNIVDSEFKTRKKNEFQNETNLPNNQTNDARVESVQQSNDTFSPTHELADGTPVTFVDNEDDSYFVDANGDEYTADESVTPIASDTPATNTVVNGETAVEQTQQDDLINSLAQNLADHYLQYGRESTNKEFEKEINKDYRGADFSNALRSKLQSILIANPDVSEQVQSAIKEQADKDKKNVSLLQKASERNDWEEKKHLTGDAAVQYLIDIEQGRNNPTQQSDLITKKGGVPFASEAIANTQRTLKGLNKTYSVVPVDGGFALKPNDLTQDDAKKKEEKADNFLPVKNNEENLPVKNESNSVPVSYDNVQGLLKRPSDGQPFADANKARQALKNNPKLDNEAHDVVPVQGGYAIAPIEAMDYSQFKALPDNAPHSDGVLAQTYEALTGKKAEVKPVENKNGFNETTVKGTFSKKIDGILFNTKENKDGTFNLIASRQPLEKGSNVGAQSFDLGIHDSIESASKAADEYADRITTSSVEKTAENKHIAGDMSKNAGEIDTSNAQSNLSNNSSSSEIPNSSSQPEQFVTVKDQYGVSYRVKQSELDGNNTIIRTFTKDGKPKDRIHRENIDLTGEKNKEWLNEVKDNPLFNVVTDKNGNTFSNPTSAKTYATKNGYAETHEVVPASTIKDGVEGYALKRKISEEPTQTESAQVEKPTSQEPKSNFIMPPKGMITEEERADMDALKKKFAQDIKAANESDPVEIARKAKIEKDSNRRMYYNKYSKGLISELQYEIATGFVNNETASADEVAQQIISNGASLGLDNKAQQLAQGFNYAAYKSGDLNATTGMEFKRFYSQSNNLLNTLNDDIADTSVKGMAKHLIEKFKAAQPIHIENGKATPATAKEINKSLTKGDKNSKRSFAEIKADLLSQIDDAISKAKSEKEQGYEIKGRNYSSIVDTYGEPVFFNVIGDGKFRVHNTKEHLEDFKARVEKEMVENQTGLYENKTPRKLSRTKAPLTQANSKIVLENYIKDAEADLKRSKHRYANEEETKQTAYDNMDFAIQIAEDAGITDNPKIEQFKKMLNDAGYYGDAKKNDDAVEEKAPRVDTTTPIKQVIHKPSITIDDIEEGDEIAVLRNGLTSNNGGSRYNGVVIKKYKTKFDIEADYMGKPQVLEKLSLPTNQPIMLRKMSEPDTIYTTDKEKVESWNKQQAEKKAPTTDTKPATEVSVESNEPAQPTLTSSELEKSLANAARDSGIGYNQNKDGTYNLTVDGKHVATVDYAPSSADQVTEQILKNYKAALDSEGKTLPSNPEDMTRDQFLIANKFGNLIEDFEISGADIQNSTGGLKKNADGGFEIDHDALYDRIQAQKSERVKKIDAPETISEEDYLNKHGAGRWFGESALHHNRAKGKTAHQKNVDAQSQKDTELFNRREELRKEYREKVARGEIKEPTRNEDLLRQSSGHSDNESVQAARRLLSKKYKDLSPQQRLDHVTNLAISNYEQDKKFYDGISEKEIKGLFLTSFFFNRTEKNAADAFKNLSEKFMWQEALPMKLAFDLFNLGNEKDNHSLLFEKAGKDEYRLSDKARYLIKGVYGDISAIDKNSRFDGGKTVDDEIKPSKSTTPNTDNHTRVTLTGRLAKVMQDTFGKGWFGRLISTGKFKVVDSKQANEIINGKTVKHSIDGNILAFYNPADQTTYFVADNISKNTSDSALKGLMLHELGVHAFEFGKNKADYQAILNQAKVMIESNNPKIKKALNRALKSFGISELPSIRMGESVNGYTYSSSNIFSAKSTIKTFLDEIQAISSSSVHRSITADRFKDVSNGRFSATDDFANFLVSSTIGAKGFDALSIPMDSGMFSSMRNNVSDDKIFNSIVQFIPIDVMNMLVTGKVSPDMNLHNVAVFINLLSINANDSISATSDTSSSVLVSELHSARFTTGKIKVNSSPSDNRFGDVNNFSTGNAVFTDSSHKKTNLDNYNKSKIITQDDILNEVLAYLVENHPNLDVVQRALAWFRNALRVIGNNLKGLEKVKFMQWANKLTPEDLTYMATSALRKADSNLRPQPPKGGVKFSKDALLAPNGKPSNLNAMQHAQVRTPEFKAWFGDWENDPQNASKVVDENGEPLVVYHGTDADFSEFMKKDAKHGRLGGDGYYFAYDSNISSGYAKKTNGVLMPVFLNLKDPFYGNPFKLEEPRKSMVLDGEGDFDNVLKNAGFDSKIDKDVGILIAFESNQIKSATGNNGNFDAKNNDIRYSKTVTFEDTQGKVTQDDYDKSREIQKNKWTHFKDTSKRFANEFTHGAGNFLSGARTRLENISPKLGAKYIQLERNIVTHEAKAIKAVQPFLAKARTMTKNDQADFDYAMKNADSDKINQLVDKYAMRDEYNATRATLDKLREDAIDTGLAIGKIEEYFPRVLRDAKGLLNAMGKGDAFPVFTRRIREYAQELGVNYSQLSDDLKAELINSMIENNYNGMGGLSVTKERKFEKIPPELNQFYLDSSAAMMQHIHQMVKHIEYRRFLGHVPEKVGSIRRELGKTQAEIVNLNHQIKVSDDEQTTADLKKQRNELIGTEKQLSAYLGKYLLQRDYKENIATYIIKAIADGEISHSQEHDVHEILSARLHEHGATGVWAAYKNLSLIDTMGSPISAITQIGDFAWALYEGGGLFSAGGYKAIGKALRGQAAFDRTDYGLERIAQEFTESDTFAKAVDKTFGIVGIKAITGKAADSLLNAISDKLTKQAKANHPDLMKKLETYFDKDAPQVLSDLKKGVINDNTRLMIYSRYLDFAPVAMSELPIKYQTAGNGRLFYTLKTYTLKLFDVYRREAAREIFSGDKQRAMQGMKNLVSIMALLMLTGAGGDALKDWLLGRKTDFDDRIIDNLWKLAGLSKFITWQVRREGIGTAALKQMLPPFAFMNALGNDVIHATDINRHPKNEMWVNGLDVTNSIPVVGKIYYWQVGRGTQKRKEIYDIRFNKEKQKLSDVNDEFEQLEGEDKAAFLKKHRTELERFHYANRVQARLNKLKSVINKQRTLPKTKERESTIEKIEQMRETVIANFMQ